METNDQTTYKFNFNKITKPNITITELDDNKTKIDFKDEEAMDMWSLFIQIFDIILIFFFIVIIAKITILMYIWVRKKNLCIFKNKLIYIY